MTADYSVTTFRNYNSLLGRLSGFMAEQKLGIGDRLPAERRLASIFGVSRSSVRTAIRSLVERGILESRQGDGTYICGNMDGMLENALISAVDSERTVFDEILEFRKIIEPQIARIAARRRTIEQLDALKIIACDQQRRMLLEKPDGDLDAKFHLQIARCTGNPFLIDSMCRINEAYSSSRASDLRSLEWRQFSLCSHLRIIDTLERQDEDACAAEIKSHLETVEKSHPMAFAQKETVR